MRIGLIGLGKLGLPYALALERYGGHEVIGFDVSEAVRVAIASRTWPHKEAQLPELLRETRLVVADTVAEVVEQAELVCIAVQTPHGPGFEGVTRLGEERRDFDYQYLRQAVGLCVAASPTKLLRLAIISTVLPGTYQREIAPLLRLEDEVVYMPSFIAMSTTIHDLLHPEFVLLGANRAHDAALLAERMWLHMHTAPVLHTSIVTAETIKVTYNAVIGTKVIVANAIMEVCEKTGANADDVQRAFALATKRLASAAYLGGGMGDGGPCHGRDGIALSWLARDLNLSVDVFGEMMIAREKQTAWLAERAAKAAADRRLPLVVVGQSYKAGTNITTGSPAVLLVNMLTEQGIEPAVWDDTHSLPLGAYCGAPAVFLVTVRDPRVYQQRWPEGSLVIDPWGRIADQPGVEVWRVGRP